MEPVARKFCTVERAMKLGASAVGYTIYPGSALQEDMMVEFSEIVDRAHDYGLPAIVWMYPRGSYISNPNNTELLAYCARIGAELGADIIKMKYNGDLEGFKWVTKAAGKTKVVISGGNYTDIPHLLDMTHQIMQTGAKGMAIGRNIWQHDKPFSLTKAIQAIIYHGKTVEEAKKFLE